MIDWGRLNELKEEIGAEDLAVVVSVFLDETDEVMADLDTPARLAAQLHFLKGSALNLGLSAFATLCGEGEIAAGAGRPELVDLPRLRAVYAASRTAFLGALSQGDAA